MTSNKKKFYPSFPAELLNNNWPFSSNLAEALFNENIFNSYSSLRTFLIKTAITYTTDTGEPFDLDDPYVESFDFQRYLINPFFSLQNKTVYYFGSSDVEYEDCIKITDAESGKVRFLVEYNLDNISYETIVCEAIRFHIKHSVNNGYPEWITDITLWPEIIFYLLYTTYSQFVKNLIEEE